MLAVPCLKTGAGLDTHPAFLRSMRWLRRAGIALLSEPERSPPKKQVPPQRIPDTLHTLIEHSPPLHNEKEALASAGAAQVYSPCSVSSSMISTHGRGTSRSLSKRAYVARTTPRALRLT